MNKILLSVIVHSELEKKFEDFFISNDLVEGFSSLKIEGHGSGVNLLSLEEKVVGHVEYQKFEFVIDEAKADVLLKEIKEKFPKVNVFFWMNNLIKSGVL